MTRIAAARKHSLARLKERYGLHLTDAGYEELCLELAAQDERDGLPLLARRHLPAHHRRALVNIRIQGVQTRAVYDRQERLIVTFLPATKARAANESDNNWKRRQERKNNRYRRHEKYREIR